MMATLPESVRRVGRRLLGDRGSMCYANFIGLPREYREKADPQHRTSVERLRPFRNKHTGQRCFIIGNGPSLKNTDLTLLKNEVTFGMNRIYLMFNQIGFTTTYYVSVNDLVVEQCAPDIEAVSCPKFISFHARHLIHFTPDMMFLRSRRTPTFSLDITKGVWEGATVTYVAMQVAYYLGFHQVILVGVDHSFATQGTPHTTVVSQGDDPNHFDPRYFGKGFRWQLPDLETSELAYRMAKRNFEAAGRQIIDATVGGKLEVFPKVDYGSLFK